MRWSRALTLKSWRALWITAATGTGAAIRTKPIRIYQLLMRWLPLSRVGRSVRISVLQAGLLLLQASCGSRGAGRIMDTGNIHLVVVGRLILWERKGGKVRKSSQNKSNIVFRTTQLTTSSWVFWGRGFGAAVTSPVFLLVPVVVFLPLRSCPSRPARAVE